MIKIHTKDHCVQCDILKQQLKQHNFEFEEIPADVKTLREKGFMGAPVLEVDNQYMNMGEALKWINS